MIDRLITFDIKILDVETHHSLLEKCVPSEYKEEFLQEVILDSVW